jgi:hypothetical protein
MLDNGIGNKQREFPTLHQIGQQESVLSSERNRIKDTGLDVSPGASNCEASRVQVSNATVGLKHVVLKGYEPQLFRSADQIGAIPHQPKLKAIMLR